MINGDANDERINNKQKVSKLEIKKELKNNIVIKIFVMVRSKY